MTVLEFDRSRQSDGEQTAASTPSVAVLIPCYNEAATIEAVVTDFQRALPTATIYVCDNASTDHTAERARAAGATVFAESHPGKGSAIRRLFASVEADIYVMVDGDDTYQASEAPHLIERLASERLDMINVARASEDDDAYRFGHQFGNRAITKMISSLFGGGFEDVFSGYRVFSRRFVKSFPALSSGFEIETELTVHALSLRMPVAEERAVYRARPDGSESKLRTYRDGLEIVHTIGLLVKEEQPLRFFGAIALVLVLASIGMAVPVIIEYLDTGLVPRLPTAILASATMLAAFLSLFAGLILDSVARARRETKWLRYLEYPAAGQKRETDSEVARASDLAA
jgi:glycosyltransferase involved in cell wall biosynthesis